MNDLKVGNLLKYNFLYSNESFKFGIVCGFNSDPNFSTVVKIVSGNFIDQIPYSLLDYEILT